MYKLQTALTESIYQMDPKPWIQMVDLRPQDRQQIHQPRSKSKTWGALNVFQHLRGSAISSVLKAALYNQGISLVVSGQQNVRGPQRSATPLFYANPNRFPQFHIAREKLHAGRWFGLVYSLKTVIVHSFVKIPEGIIRYNPSLFCGYLEHHPKDLKLWSIPTWTQIWRYKRTSTRSETRVFLLQEHILLDGARFPYFSGWWFEPLWKILVNWDDYSQYMGK